MARLNSLLSLAAFVSGALASGGSFKTSLVVTYGNASPDGFERPMFMVNGTSPGPYLQFDQDDDVEITVINNANQNITIHWHGIIQQGTPWSDGVPGVTQNPIRPGHNYIYRFTATQSGAFWYHSHLSTQVQDGCVGPINIRQRSGAENPFHLIDDNCDALQEMTEAARNPKSLFLQDWFHRPADDIHAISEKSKFEIGCFSSFLFNGRGRVTCHSAEELAQNANPAMQLALSLVPDKNLTLTSMGCLPPDALDALVGGLTSEPDDTSLLPNDIYNDCQPTDSPLEIITVGLGDFTAISVVSNMGFAEPTFTIDQQELIVYAVDGQIIEPQTVNAINVGSGDRYTFFVQPDTPGDYAIRLVAQGPFQIIEGVAILRVVPSAPAAGSSCDNGYGSGGQSSTPSPAANPAVPTSTPYFSIGGAPLDPAITLYNFTLGVPFPAIPISQDVAAFHRLEMTLVNNAVTWSLNGIPENVTGLEANNPPLLYQGPNAQLEPGNSITTLNGTWIDILLITSLTVPHMIHKHSSDYRVIATGVGEFPWNSTADAVKHIPGAFNLDNPPARDTMVSIPAVDAKTPGWMLIRFPSVNPGPFLLHCHILSHMAGGMLMVLHEGTDAWPTIPKEYAL